MSSGLYSSEAVEEEGIRPKIQQRNGIRHVEFPLTRGRNSKQGSQAREKRIGEMD
jgi:hypothetical protein